jgi:hypothetical protein
VISVQTKARTRQLALTISATSIASLAAIVFAASPASAYPAPPGASAQAIYTVENTGGGVYWRWDPHTADYQAISGYGPYDGYEVAIDCWAYGDPVGPYGNRLWYYAEQWSPTNYVGDGSGWINDHYLNTPGTAANPQPIGPECNGY